MYSIYTTPGFIIGSRPSGEAGKLVSVFTRDLGLVFASAQGIRFEKSKLRSFTQNYSFGRFSFVKGKEFWRLTSASEFINDSRDPVFGALYDPAESPLKGPSSPFLNPEARVLIARIASLLERLLHGEEAHPELFDCIENAHQFIVDSPGLNAEDLQTLESLIVIRILHHLGYVGDAFDLNGYVHSKEINKGLLADLKGKWMVMNKHINKALRESHL